MKLRIACFTLLISSVIISSVFAANNNLYRNYQYHRQHSFDAALHRTKRKIDKALAQTTSEEKSDLQKNHDKREKASSNPLGIALFRPNYILPFYYTVNPYQSIYTGRTPANQKISQYEFKYQFSVMVPIWRHILGQKASLNIAYTQMSYWQFYIQSQYFRETDYEGEVFVNYNFYRNWFWMLGIVHQSNGKGLPLERSWNRVYSEFVYSNGNLMVAVKPWILIFERYSSDLHNPDIRHYLGHGLVRVSYNFHNVVTSLMIRNAVESGFKRGAEQLTFSFPLWGRIRGYVQGFSGFGQSLIEYNHYTNAVGVGISVNDWL